MSAPDREVLEDIIWEAIFDSLDQDWSSRDGAKAVMGALDENQLAPLYLLREQHEAMADVMQLRRMSANPEQRAKAEAAIAVWRRVDAYLKEVKA